MEYYASRSATPRNCAGDRSLSELEAPRAATGAQLGSREAFLQLQNGQFVQTQNTTNYYVSLSYRISFNR